MSVGSLPRLARPFVGCVLAVVLAVSVSGAALPSSGSFPSVLGRAYPLEADVSLIAGLFHWVDSLAGTSGGKTIPAYRREFEGRFGRMHEEDLRHLRRFAEVRESHAARSPGRTEPGTGIRLSARSALLASFCAAATVEDALEDLEGEIPLRDLDALRGTLEHFRPRYEQVWDGGRVPLEFLDRVRSDGASRRTLGRLLRRMARFFGVNPWGVPRPRLILVPVPHGHGTHAEALGHQLLIEVRPGESLADEASPIVHENAHFLWKLMPREKVDRLRGAALDVGPEGARAWQVLHEALPTALGQGVADRSLRPGWSLGYPWYHTSTVDAYAKEIFPLVLQAIEKGAHFDEAFVRRLTAEVSRGPSRSEGPGLTPREP